MRNAELHRRRLACRKTLASKQRAPGPKTTYSQYACSAGSLLSWPKIRQKTRGREESRVINPGLRENRARRPLQISKTRGSSVKQTPARAAGRGRGKSAGSGGAKKKSSGGPASKLASALDGGADEYTLPSREEVEAKRNDARAAAAANAPPPPPAAAPAPRGRSTRTKRDPRAGWGRYG